METASQPVYRAQAPVLRLTTNRIGVPVAATLGMVKNPIPLSSHFATSKFNAMRELISLIHSETIGRAIEFCWSVEGSLLKTVERRIGPTSVETAKSPSARM